MRDRGAGRGAGRTELALGETEVVEEEMEVREGYDNVKKKMVSMVRDKGAEVSIEVLPDHARRSKHSRLATFSVTAGGKTLLLAAAGHAEMWEWARAVRRRGQPEGAGAEQAAALLGAAMFAKCKSEKTTKAEVQELLLQGAEVDWADSVVDELAQCVLHDERGGEAAVGRAAAVGGRGPECRLHEWRHSPRQRMLPCLRADPSGDSGSAARDAGSVR